MVAAKAVIVLVAVLSTGGFFILDPDIDFDNILDFGYEQSVPDGNGNTTYISPENITASLKFEYTVQQRYDYLYEVSFNFTLESARNFSIRCFIFTLHSISNSSIFFGGSSFTQTDMWTGEENWENNITNLMINNSFAIDSQYHPDDYTAQEILDDGRLSMILIFVEDGEDFMVELYEV